MFLAISTRQTNEHNSSNIGMLSNIVLKHYGEGLFVKILLTMPMTVVFDHTLN